MTLRIFEQDDEGEVVMALHGWLSAAEVGELERLFASRAQPPRIDLAQLTGVDMDGLRALRRLREDGARLTGATPYVALLLERTSEPSGTEPSGTPSAKEKRGEG
jgi:CheY-like chemotaxis protein